MSLARATAPTIVRCVFRAAHRNGRVLRSNCSSMFAFSVARNLLGGFAWVLPMLVMALGGVYQSTRVVKIRT